MNLPDNTKLRIAELLDTAWQIELMLQGTTIEAGSEDATLVWDTARGLERAATVLRSHIRGKSR